MATRNGTLQPDVRNDNQMNQTITIFMPITRAWRIPEIAKMLWNIDTGGRDCKLLICIDNSEITKQRVEDNLNKWELPFSYAIIHTNKHPVGEVNMATRRNRIKDMLEFSKPYIPDTDFVFMVEDDTEIKPDAMISLLTDYENLAAVGVKVGLIEGAQVGRHGYRMIGGWRMDDLNDPQVMETIPFTRSTLLEKIDGGGLYCMLTPTKLFKAHKWQWHAECFSVDVMYGIELRKQGYQNFIDWSVEAGHVQKNEATLYPNENCAVVRYEKQPEGFWKLMNTKKGYIS